MQEDVRDILVQLKEEAQRSVDACSAGFEAGIENLLSRVEAIDRKALAAQRITDPQRLREPLVQAFAPIVQGESKDTTAVRALLARFFLPLPARNALLKLVDLAACAATLRTFAATFSQAPQAFSGRQFTQLQGIIYEFVQNIRSITILEPLFTGALRPVVAAASRDRIQALRDQLGTLLAKQAGPRAKTERFALQS